MMRGWRLDCEPRKSVCVPEYSLRFYIVSFVPDKQMSDKTSDLIIF
jgi:hypothetical protein